MVYKGRSISLFSPHDLFETKRNWFIIIVSKCFLVSYNLLDLFQKFILENEFHQGPLIHFLKYQVDFNSILRGTVPHTVMN